MMSHLLNDLTNSSAHPALAGVTHSLSRYVLFFCVMFSSPFQVEETFYQHEFVHGWFRGLADLVREVSLESLRLNVHEFSCSLNTDPRSKAKWQSQDVSRITDNVLEDLANLSRSPQEVLIAGTHRGIVTVMSFTVLGGIPGMGTNAQRDGEGANASPRSPPSSLRKLWLSGPSDGPTITEGMAALGAGMPKLQELVVDRLNVSEEGWKKFASARIEAAAAAPAAADDDSDYTASTSARDAGSDAGHSIETATPTLRRIRYVTHDPRFLPSAATRNLLEKTVSKNVTMYVNARGPAFVAGVKATASGTSSTSGAGSASGIVNGCALGEAGPGSVSGSGGDPMTLPSTVVDCEGALVEIDNGGGVPEDRAGAASKKKLHVLHNSWVFTSNLDAADL